MWNNCQSMLQADCLRTCMRLDWITVWYLLRIMLIRLEDSYCRWLKLVLMGG